MAPAPQRRLLVRPADASARARFLQLVPPGFGSRACEPFVVEGVTIGDEPIDMDISSVAKLPIESESLAIVGVVPSGVVRMIAAHLCGNTLRVYDTRSLCEEPAIGSTVTIGLYAKPDLSDHLVKMAKARDITARYRATLDILAQ